MDGPWAHTNSQDSPWPELGGSHHLFSYSIFVIGHKGPHPNVILSRNSQVESFKFLEIRIPGTLESHNFLCRPLTKMKTKEKL